MMHNKWLLPLVTLFAATALICTGVAAWTIADSQIATSPIAITVNHWNFGDIEQGAVIIVDTDGTITIDGEEVEATIDSAGNDTYNYGDVTIKIETDADGNLVLSEFTTSNEQFALWGSTIYLPTAVVIDGVSYPVTGISQPLAINVSDPWIGTVLYNNAVHIPEGYTYICDGAFAALTQRTIFEMPSTIISIGSGAFAPARNVTQTVNYAGTEAQWNEISKASDYENGRGTLRINYNN